MPAISLTDFSTARTNADAARAQASAADAQVARLAAARATRLRTGAAATDLDQQLAAARTARQAARDRERSFIARIAELSATLVTTVTPEGLVATLDAAHPICLLPVRIETRFFDNGTTLGVRIYPDQVHIDQHETELTDQEVTAGKAYWLARWNDSSDDAGHAAWRTLGTAIAPRRAAWVAQALTPTNLVARGTAAVPAYPAVGVRPANWSRAPRATLLPDRWVVIGYRGTMQVFRKWTAYVPDALAVTPAPTEDASPLPDDALPTDEATRWLTDFNEAVRVGMGIVVAASDLLAGFSFSQGLDRVLVVGVDWTLTPDQAAARLDQLLTAHAYSDGLSFVPQGTPTNATAASRTPAEATRAQLALALDPVTLAARVVQPDDTGSRLAGALGVAATSPVTLAPGSSLREHAIASDVFNALWESTLGYTLAQFWASTFSDATIATLRSHALQFVAPFGPYAAMRIGKQPYGILPVVSTVRYHAPSAGFEDALAQTLSSFRALWLAASEKAVRVGRSADPGKDLVQVLQQAAVARSFWFRYVYGPAAVANTVGLSALAQAQEATLQLLTDVLQTPARPELAGHAHDSRAYRLQAPLVAEATITPGTPLVPNTIRSIAKLTRTPDGYDDLTDRQDAPTILEALLAHAALRELHRAGMGEIHQDGISRGVIPARPRQVALPTPELTGIEAPVHVPAGSVAVSTPGEISRLVIPTLTGQRTVSSYLADGLARGARASNFTSLNAFLASLDRLANVPALDLDRATRAVLDCCAYRLDAWLTSLATRRLGDLRAATPAGIHVGAYGWVDDLRPSARPDSLGYIHAPSLAHAATAAVLRSGHLAHRDSEHDALNIDLQSSRVQVALHVLEGMAQGQPLSALLGYRFERGLRERGLLFAKYILPIRQLAPLRQTGAPPQPGVALESVAARDVVDGVVLLDRFRTQGEKLFAGLGASPADLAVVVQEATKVADAYDAVSDLLLAESVHQAVAGNNERAGAALAVIDQQAVAPSPAVVRTPRSGRGYSQRVVVLIGDGTPPAGWPAADTRAKAEPRLNAWIGNLLGSPTRFHVAAHIGDAPATDVPIADLGLSPLSLVLAEEEGSGGRESELRDRLVQLVASRAPAPVDASLVVLGDRAPAGALAGTIGLGALRVALKWIRALVTMQRPLDARDLAISEEQPIQGVDANEIQARANALVAAATAAKAAIDPIAKTPTAVEATVRAALLRVANLGIQGAFPRVPTGLSIPSASADRLRLLRDQLAEIAATLGATMTTIAALDHQFAQRASVQPPTDEERARFHADRIRQLLGNAFPILPRFVAANGAELAAAAADRTALCNGDRFAPSAWLTRLALVRPGVDRLARVMSTITLLRGGPLDLIPLQLPHVPGDRWLALPSGPVPSDAQVSIVAASIGAIDFTKTMAGFVCDGWNEVVPSDTETTGVSFHYDAPGARPPQTLLLAVPPPTPDATWSLEALLGTVLEAHDLGRIRAATAREVEFAGVILPAIYLPQSYSKDVPSVRLDRISDILMALNRAGFDLLGKS